MNKKLAFFLVVLVLSALACGQFYVQNSGPFPVAVKVTLPDGAYGAKRLLAGEAGNWYAFTGGTYTVDIIPEEIYVGQLQEVRDEAVEIIFSDFPILDEKMLSDAARDLLETQVRLQEMTFMFSCTGKVPDNPAQDISLFDTKTIDVTVTVNFDEGSNTWSCGE